MIRLSSFREIWVPLAIRSAINTIHEFEPYLKCVIQGTFWHRCVIPHRLQKHCVFVCLMRYHTGWTDASFQWIADI